MRCSITRGRRGSRSTASGSSTDRGGVGEANAFFTGFGSRKRIALFDTLIEKQTTPELVAIVAHEVGHYKRRHIVKGLALSLAHTGVLFWLLSVFLDRPGLFDAFGVAGPVAYAGLVFFGLLFTPIDLVLSVLVNAFSRRYEFEADAFAATRPAVGSRS